MTNAALPAAPADGFEAAVTESKKESPEVFEGIPETPPLDAPANTGGVLALAAPGGDAVSKCLANLSPESAERWLQVPFNVAAAVMKDEELKLTKDERDMMSGAAHVLLEKHLPDMLRKTDSPELTMLGAGLVIYASRVLGKRWKAELETNKPQSETVTGPAAVGTVLHVNKAPEPDTTRKGSIITAAFPA